METSKRFEIQATTYSRKGDRMRVCVQASGKALLLYHSGPCRVYSTKIQSWTMADGILASFEISLEEALELLATLPAPK